MVWQVLTGDQFHLFDPLGTYLIGEVSEPQAADQQDDTGGAEAVQADGTAGSAAQAGEAGGNGGDQQPPPFYPSSGPRPGEPVSRRQVQRPSPCLLPVCLVACGS